MSRTIGHGVSPFASAWHGPLMGPGVAVTNALVRRTRTRRIDAFVPVSSVVAVNTKLPGRSPYEVIPNFIPDALVENEATPNPDGPIVFVGDLSRDKGIDVLLAAHKLGGLPRLVLAGRVLENTPLDLSDQVELRGLLDHASVIDLMRTASVVVLPSIVPDCCPTVVLEAMAVGRPVVAAASGGIVDLVDHGVTGLLVAPGDPTALVRGPGGGRHRSPAGSDDGSGGARTGPVVHRVRGGRPDRTAV